MSRSRLMVLLTGASFIGSIGFSASSYAGQTFGFAGTEAALHPQLAPLTNAELAHIRGGFEWRGSDGLTYNLMFGFNTWENGQHVQDISGTIVKNTPEGSPTVNIINQSFNTDTSHTTETSTSKGTNFTTTVNNAGNVATTIVSSIGSNGMGSFVKNTANNSWIQLVQTYNINMTGLQTELQNAAAATHLIQSLVPH